MNFRPPSLSFLDGERFYSILYGQRFLRTLADRGPCQKIKWDVGLNVRRRPGSLAPAIRWSDKALHRRRRPLSSIEWAKKTDLIGKHTDDRLTDAVGGDLHTLFTSQWLHFDQEAAPYSGEIQHSSHIERWMDLVTGVRLAFEMISYRSVRQRTIELSQLKP